MTGKTVERWSLKSLFLLVYGLIICCFAAARDGLDKTIQHAIDGSCAPGFFPLVSLSVTVVCVGALAIIIAVIAAPAAKSKHTRPVWFTVMSGDTALKVVTMELTRIILR